MGLSRPNPGQRSLQRLRRKRREGERDDENAPVESRALVPTSSAGVGWDQDASEAPATTQAEADADAPSRILSLLAVPGVHSISVELAAERLKLPRADVANAIEALEAAGELLALPGQAGRWTVSRERKAELELMFREVAFDMGENTALEVRQSEMMALVDDDEPRLPVTAGLLSVFLPGTGQLLNGDVGRASLVFAVWSLALLTNLSPIWTFVCLYAGAEAFFTAKVRGMERKLALEAAPEGPKP